MCKCVFSLNCAAYIQMLTGIAPELEIETCGKGNGLVKCVFPEFDAVTLAIEEYRTNE